jgi:hypothetical protein
MKRRYTILFFVALSPLIGLSWLATTIGFSMWAMRGIGLFGMILAAIIAGFAMVRNVDVRWPAGVVALVSLPNASEMLRVVGQLGDLLTLLGASLVLVVVGSLATVASALAIALLPKPPPRAEPQVAPARVVDSD